MGRISCLLLRGSSVYSSYTYDAKATVNLALYLKEKIEYTTGLNT